MSRTFSAAIFDLDGTLIDSLPDLTAAINKLLAEEGLAPLQDDEVGPMVGDGAGVLVARAFAARGGLPGPDVAPYLGRFLAHYEPNSTVLTRPWDGVVETLAAMKAQGMALAVCTNKPSAATHAVLRELDLDDYFSVVIGGDDVPALKPDPGHVNAVLDRLGIGPDDAIFVGDSINDVLAAKAANVLTVIVEFGYSRVPPRELGADLVIERFGQLLDVVATR